MVVNMKIGEKIRYLRELHGISQSKLSDVLNVSQQTISQYETNKRHLPNEIVVQIASYFNVSVNYLFDFVDDTKPEDTLILKIEDPIIREEVENYANYLLYGKKNARDPK